MRRTVLAVIFLFPSLAHSQSPEGRAYYELNKCITTAVDRYTPLEEPIGDIADVAVAACDAHFNALREALENSPQKTVIGTMMADIRKSSRARALVAIADKRLGQ